MTSIVWPDIEVTTSPGRCALPSGMFSTSPQTPMTLTLALRAASACIAPATAPAPPMSHFMSSMPGGGLSVMPPVSKVTPLPTRTTGVASPPPFQRIVSTCASRSEPWLTPRSAPMPSARHLGLAERLDDQAFGRGRAHTLDEAFRIDHVRRLADEVAGQRDARGDGGEIGVAAVAADDR